MKYCMLCCCKDVAVVSLVVARVLLGVCHGIVGFLPVCCHMVGMVSQVVARAP